MLRRPYIHPPADRNRVVAPEAFFKDPDGNVIGMRQLAAQSGPPAFGIGDVAGAVLH
jgi:hypothetical protein